MKFSYPCIAGQKEDGSFRVYFPDLEMCEATGRDLEEALENAKEAERSWIELELSEDDFELPARSGLGELSPGPGESIHTLSVNIRLMEGYDE